MVSSPFQSTQNTYFSNYFVSNYDLPPILNNTLSGWSSQDLRKGRRETGSPPTCLSYSSKPLARRGPLKHTSMFPSLRWGVWVLGSPAGPEDSPCLSLRALQRRPSLLSPLYPFCALYFTFYEVLSPAWYHFILPSACEVDCRNLIRDEEERHREVGQLAQGHTAVEWPCQGSHECLRISRADFLFTTSKNSLPIRMSWGNSPHA